MATWPSGKAEACKAFTPSSNLGVASILYRIYMRYIFCAFILLLCGCSNTWHGVKEDSKDAYEWSKEKVNQGASWVEQKTSK